MDYTPVMSKSRTQKEMQDLVDGEKIGVKQVVHHIADWANSAGTFGFLGD